MDIKGPPDVAKLSASLGKLPEPVARPALVVVSGLPGTGKTYFSQKLAARLPFVILESDAVRKTLFPRPVYTPVEHYLVFRAIHGLIAQLLKRGIPVILDATSLSEGDREPLYAMAEKAGARLVLVQMRAPEELVKQRLTQRSADGKNLSDADWAVYQMLAPKQEPMRRKHYVADTSRDISPVIDRVVKEISRGNSDTKGG